MGAVSVECALLMTPSKGLTSPSNSLCGIMVKLGLWESTPVCLSTYQVDPHSPPLLLPVMDGTPVVRMCDEVLDALQSPSFDHGNATSSAESSLPEPLDWSLTPTLQTSITTAQKAAHKLITSHALSFLETDYGKATVKSFGVSPDSWTQMIIQLAYHRLLKGQGKQRGGGTYESATTRRFLKGRTECIRVVTEQSMKWCDSMLDPSVDIPERRRLFKEAVGVHARDAKAAGNAMGIDRHLFGQS
jgi:carnitine O-acetyltransferase